MSEHGAIGAPSPWVRRAIGWLPRGSSLLDFAAGSGRHARLAESAGCLVTAADRDGAALSTIGGTVRCVTADLEAGPWPFAPGSFDAVVVCNYLFRPRFAELCSLLSPGGMLVYETFARGNERYGRPRNPDFLLAPGELAERSRAAGLQVLAFEDGFAGTSRRARIQRIVALGAAADLEAFAIE
jgi:SAM-dependent methyltransferase